MSDFVQERLSNWYVRLCRRRFWKGSYGPDKIAAYQTLYECLLIMAKLMAPIAPFYADRLYQDLTQATQTEHFSSVHLSDFPKGDNSVINPALQEKINSARIITSLALSLRKKERIKVRQPLQKIMIPYTNATEKGALEEIQDILKSEINVKEVQLLGDASAILVKEIKPNFKVLGPRFGAAMKAVVQHINNLGEADIKKLENDGVLPCIIDEKEITLSSDDVIISSKDIEGWQVANSNGKTVALDITLSDQLIAEGNAREVVNRIQNLRKEHNFKVTDTITVNMTVTAPIQAALVQFKEYIMSETLAERIGTLEDTSGAQEIEINDQKLFITINKMNNE